MISPKKQAKLKQHRDIIFAIIDDIMERYSGMLVFDESDWLADFYKQEKYQTEEDFQNGRLSKLQKRYNRFIEGPRNRVDLNFGKYIKDKTGYDIDIFEGLQDRINAILEQKEIRTQKEGNDVSTMIQIHIYQPSSIDQKKVDTLINLLRDFDMRRIKPGYSTEINQQSKEVSQVISPDGKRSLKVVQWNNLKNSSTYVSIHFKETTGPIYGTMGINQDIKAYWKDNSTIVIETRKEYIVGTKYEQVQNFQDLIKIEYIEN